MAEETQRYYRWRETQGSERVRERNGGEKGLGRETRHMRTRKVERKRDIEGERKEMTE